jgi:membrane-associated phospholipid phosphatase
MRFATPAVACLLLFSVPAIARPEPLAAQQQDGSAIRWWHGAVAVGGLSTLMLLDGPAQRFAQDNRGAGSNNVAGFVRHFGQPEVYGTVSAGLIMAGLVSHHERVAQAGGRLAVALLVAGAANQGAKLAFGRPRPDESLDADGFRPFSGQTAMPSGHTTMAFALATSLADEVHQPWAKVGLYGLATTVGWSRLNDNRHWLSDVAAGALVGITSAKLASGRWRIFNIHPPGLVATPRGMGLGWQARF